MMTFPLAPFERILKKAGAKRVSKAAMEEFAKVMEDKLLQVATEAVTLAKHAGRKTILGEDIRLAKKKFV
ncbi:MAG: histone family protein [Candidatus Aenigmatarchaeota archaeon]